MIFNNGIHIYNLFYICTLACMGYVPEINLLVFVFVFVFDITFNERKNWNTAEDCHIPSYRDYIIPCELSKAQLTFMYT